jgi:hypothetical protein
VKRGVGRLCAAADIERQIDENLRLIYQQCVEEEMPERLYSLLSQLEDYDEPK